MSNLKKLFAAVVLTLALALPAFAGVIDCGVTTPPPPPPSSPATAESEMTHNTGSGEATADDSLMKAALNLLECMLALF